MTKIPALEQYGISPKTGFLPEREPLQRLAKYYEPWERIVDDIGLLLIASKLRDRVVSLQQLSTDTLGSDPELQRAYLVLCLISHAYVWGSKGQKVLSTLPRNIAQPWIQVSAKLGIRPISCHAALVYYNWKLLDSDGPMVLENMATLHTISGGIDESWFYLITVAIEAIGAEAMPCITKTLEDVLTEDVKDITQQLTVVAKVIKDISAMLKRMAENCDPYIFYHRVRIYFSGWSNSKDLPQGLVYEGDQGEIEAVFALEGHDEGSCAGEGKFYPGGSAAQSALIHALDIFLGVEHQATRGGDGVNFLGEMRWHMPGKFRAYLTALETEAPSLRQFLFQSKPENVLKQDWQKCLDVYNQCVLNIKQFRDVHIQIVTRYIIIQAKRAVQTGEQVVDIGEGYGGFGKAASKVINLQPNMNGSTSPTLVDPLASNDGLGAVTNDVQDIHITMNAAPVSRGTGGTDIIPFLKQSRDETKSTVIQNNETQ